MEQETWHDRKPTHRPVPNWLVEAKKAADAAWQEYYHIPTEDRRKQARAAEEWYWDAYEHWSRGEVPASIQWEAAQRG